MKYKNGEYCKDIACEMIGDKSFCLESCGAYQFHDWVNGHGYSILKDVFRDKIMHWLGNGQVGASSKVMAMTFAGVEIQDTSHPYDPDDFHRCLLFLEAVPEARQHLEKLRTVSPAWAALVENWDEIETLFSKEAGLRCLYGHSAPKTYEKMKEVLSEI